jgi:hypothetical protein
VQRGRAVQGHRLAELLGGDRTGSEHHLTQELAQEECGPCGRSCPLPSRGREVA